MNDTHILYGATLDTEKLFAVFDHVFSANQRVAQLGRKPVPICIWGTHGLGKTAAVEQYARNHGWQFAYCAPAQFEEMGDLHGLPSRIESGDHPHGRTTFLPPEWVPTQPGPGILLLDDINRADERILRGLMQLLQNYEMFSWALPEGWQIVATANPEGGDYSVTAMDDAMITRMLHVNLKFDAKKWAKWAHANDIDKRGIDFVLTYPESITGGRTTPRSCTQLFEQLAGIACWKESLDLVDVLARSALEDTTVGLLMSYIHENLGQLISPADILDAEEPETIRAAMSELAGPDGDIKRIDRIGAVCTRLYLHLADVNYKPGPRHRNNLVAFLLDPGLPNDLRFSLHADLAQLGSEVREMTRDPRLARAVLEGM